MGTILEYRYQYQKSKVKEQQKEIANKLFQKEQELFEYCELMQDNPCTEISITQGGVYTTFNIDGVPIKMALDDVDMEAVPYTILMRGEYEKREFDMAMQLLSFCEKDSVVFDIGANLGWYGINMKKRMQNAEVHFFEPVPNTYNRLVKNLKLNELENCIVNNMGLSDKTNIVSFFYDVTASGASSMADLREKETTKQIEVKMMMMDEYVQTKKVSKLDFVKCDVEGSEFLVYKGGKQTLNRYKPIVFSEMLRKWSAKFGYHPNDIIDFFSDMGYQCYICNGEKLIKFDRVDENTIPTNYFFLHKEKHCEIIKLLGM